MTLSDKEAGAVANIAEDLARRLDLTDVGRGYVERWARWRLRNTVVGDPVKWAPRPRCPFNLVLGDYLRDQTDGALNRWLTDEGRPNLAPATRAPAL